MKYLMFILLFILCKESNAQTNIETSLRDFDSNYYLNKPIDSLIANIPSGFDTSFIVGPSQSIYRGATLQINYFPDNQYCIIIGIADAQFITILRDTRHISYEQAWPINLLRKEKIGKITIIKGDYEVINKASL